MMKQMTKDELRNKIDELWDNMNTLWEEVDTWNRRYDDCLWFNDPERAKKAKAEVDKRMKKIVEIDKERNALCDEYNRNQIMEINHARQDCEIPDGNSHR